MAKPLKILITSGGTKVPIDMVRHIGNMSSGTFGSKIAYEALKAGHQVDFLMADGSKSPLELRVKDTEGTLGVIRKACRSIWDRWRYQPHLTIMKYSNFDQYSDMLESIAKQPYDIIVLAAAVSDYAPEGVVLGKIRSKGDLTINLKPLPKLISKIREWNKSKDLTLVGFKLLVNSNDEELVSAARDSIAKNGCDLVVANDLRDIKQGAHRLILESPGPNKSRLTRKINTDPNDPNFLAREVVKTFTWIHNIKAKKSS